MKQSVVYIGVDVAKAHLDVAWEKRSRRFDNDKRGRAALVAWIKQSVTAVQLICEASGGYEQGLLKSLEQSHFGAGQSSAAIWSCGWDPEQDGQNRRSCALSLWRSDAAIANSATLGRAKATA